MSMTCRDCVLLRAEVTQLKDCLNSWFSEVFNRFDKQDSQMHCLLESFNADLSLCVRSNSGSSVDTGHYTAIIPQGVVHVDPNTNHFELPVGSTGVPLSQVQVDPPMGVEIDGSSEQSRSTDADTADLLHAVKVEHFEDEPYSTVGEVGGDIPAGYHNWDEVKGGNGVVDGEPCVKNDYDEFSAARSEMEAAVVENLRSTSNLSAGHNTNHSDTTDQFYSHFQPDDLDQPNTSFATTVDSNGASMSPVLNHQLFCDKRYFDTPLPNVPLSDDPEHWRPDANALNMLQSACMQSFKVFAVRLLRAITTPGERFGCNFRGVLGKDQLCPAKGEFVIGETVQRFPVATRPEIIIAVDVFMRKEMNRPIRKKPKTVFAPPFVDEMGYQ